MKLSKTDRENLIQELVDDMESWDYKTLWGFAMDCRRNDLEQAFNDNELVEEYMDAFNADEESIQLALNN